MKKYPMIAGVNDSNEYIGMPCVAFRKYDGSNLRFEWDVKKGWHLFGTRYRLFDKNDRDFGIAIDLFLQKYGSDVEKIFRKEKRFRGVKNIVCFCEFFGPYSFAGQHDPSHPAIMMGGCNGDNNPKNLVMFDVSIHKKGILGPNEFLDIFGNIDVAEVIYRGEFNYKLIKRVRNGEYSVFEGVVCKGIKGNSPHGLWMVKIKTLKYLNELKRRFSDDWLFHWE
jgi:hypothetical protein